MRTLALSALVIAFTSGSALAQGTVKMKLKPEGVSKELGYYAPVRVDLSAEKPAEVTKLPEGLTAPLYGKLPLASKDGKVFVVLVDEPEGKPATLLIDTNGNGDLTDDPAPEWNGKESKGEDEKLYTMYTGRGAVALTDAYRIHLNLYRFDKSDPGRAGLADKLLFYRDYATVGQVNLGGKTYKAMLVDDRAGADFTAKGTKLLIDADSNGKWDRGVESFDASKPFNIGGTTYELTDVKPSGLSFTIRKSEKVVEEVKRSPKNEPDLSPGKQAIAFEGDLLDGAKVKFPDDYKGKIVMIDFWATWCGPCIREMPHVVDAYEKFHARGFEVLGVSLDQPNAETKIKALAKQLKMPWPHVYDGGYWNAKVAKKYGISSIPAAVLVDGTSGKILASGRDMRGDRLSKSIEKALNEKGNN